VGFHTVNEYVGGNYVFHSPVECTEVGHGTTVYGANKSVGKKTKFLVTIKFDPHDVRVVKMLYLAYLMCKKVGASIDDQWTDISEGPHRMGGRYLYKAAWRDSKAQDGGTFEVLEDGDQIMLRRGSGQ
jgi:hypothetical protein